MLNPHAIGVNIMETMKDVDKPGNPPMVIPIPITKEKPAAKREKTGFQPFQHPYNYYG